MDLTTIKDLFGEECKIGDKVAICNGYKANFSDSKRAIIVDIVKYGDEKRITINQNHKNTKLSNFIKIFNQN